MKVLVDTCVVVDALQNRKEFAPDAEQIIIYMANNRFEGFLSAKSVTDIYYLSHHFTHSDLEARTILKHIFQLFNLLDTCGIDCQNALLSNTRDFEDAIMIETAIRCGMDCIITRNTKDFSRSSVNVLSPADFLSQYSNVLNPDMH